MQPCGSCGPPWITSTRIPSPTPRLRALCSLSCSSPPPIPLILTRARSLTMRAHAASVTQHGVGRKSCVVPAARAGASAGMLRQHAASSAHAQPLQHMPNLFPAQQQSRTGLAPCTPSRLQTQRVAALLADRGSAQAESSSGTQRKLKVLIAGAGIGGLVLAVALIKKGVDVAVFERDLTAIRGEGKYRGPIQVGCCFDPPYTHTHLCSPSACLQAAAVLVLLHLP